MADGPVMSRVARRLQPQPNLTSKTTMNKPPAQLVSLARAKPFPAGAAVALIIAAVIGIPAIQAQTAPTPPPEEEEVVTLSPFQVDASRDVGYQAQNTLSGSRLNTPLKDTAAPISIFTKEFLSDIGATQLGDIVEWGVGSKVYFDEDEQNENNRIANPTRIKTRGQLASTGRNYYEWVLTVDTYNTERIELSSGPNSVLFGLGSPGGIFNTQIKRARADRTFGEITNRIDSEDSVRTTADYNQVIVPDKLALRLNLLKGESETWRRFEFDDPERFHIAGTWWLARNTALSAEYEGGTHNKLVGRSWSTRVRAQRWIAARAAGETGQFEDGWIAEPWAADGSGNNGKFTQYGKGKVPPLPDTMGQVNGAHLSLNTATGELLNLRGHTRAQDRSFSGLRSSFDDPFVPDNAVLSGPNVNQLEKLRTTTVSFEHKLLDNLFVELGYNYQHTNFSSNDWQQNFDVLQIDTNNRLPDGSLNPNAGRPYIESAPRRGFHEIDRETYRALLSYELDLTKKNRWLGSHRFAALYETTEVDNLAEPNSRLVVADRSATGFNAKEAENTANHIWFRKYVDLDKPDEFFWPGSQELAGVLISQGQNNGLDVTTEWVNAVTSASSHDDLDSWMGVMQNYWFSGRLITAFGIRREDLEQTNAKGERNAEGEFVLVPGGASLDLTNTARTYSAVLHLTPEGRFSVFYNRGENFRLPRLDQNVIGLDRPPIGTAESEDYGFKFDLFDGRVAGSILYYETDGQNLTNNAGLVPQNAINRIWDTLGDNGIITPEEALSRHVLQNSTVSDEESEGYELSLIANPTRSLRLMLVASRNETVGSSAGDELVAYLAEHGPTLFQDPTLLTSSGITIAEERADIEESVISDFQDRNGLAPRGQSKYGVNFRANYTFGGDFLKGFSAGGGVQWRSRPVIGQTPGLSGDPTRVARYGKSYHTEFLNFGYRGKFDFRNKSIVYRLQLNVDNVFQDEGDFIVTKLDTDSGVPTQYRFREPRKYSLTTTLEF